MPARRDRDDAVADEFERVADALRAGEATIYGYDVEYDSIPYESGSVSYPGGWFEFRIEHDDEAALE
jgi:hypothetical protein